MKKLLIYVPIIISLFIGCSIDETSISEENGIEQIEKIGSKKRGSNSNLTPISNTPTEIQGILTLKFKDYITREQKEVLRGASYPEFRIKEIIESECTNIEQWRILYRDPDIKQNLTTNDNSGDDVDKSEELKSLINYTDRIELDWTGGKCQHFYSTPFCCRN